MSAKKEKFFMHAFSHIWLWSSCNGLYLWRGQFGLWRAAWPLGAVTSQALHTFTLQGQIPVTEPGGQRQTWAPDTLLPEEGNYCFSDMTIHKFIENPRKLQMQTWSCPAPYVILSGASPLQTRVSRLVRHINGLKSNTWAIHYPPSNPPSSLAPPKLHINLKKCSPPLSACAAQQSPGSQ